MNGYFNPSLFDVNRPKIKANEININWEFEFTDIKYRIPVLYYFPKGLAFDMITILDNDKIRKFYEKNEQNQQPLENKFIYNHAEKPVQMIHFESIMLNNQSANNNWKSSSSIYIPWLPYCKPELCNLRKKHSFLSSTDSSFYCTRTCVEFNIMPQEPFHTFSFTLRKANHILPIRKQCKYTTGKSTKMQKIEFVHPITKQEHYLYITALEIVDRKELFSVDSQELSFHPYCIKLEYELEPELPDGEHLLLRQLNGENHQFNTSQYEKNIIGCADGITTIQTKVNSVFGEHGLPLHVEFFQPCQHIPEEIQFSIDGIYAPNYLMQNFNYSFDNYWHNVLLKEMQE